MAIIENMSMWQLIVLGWLACALIVNGTIYWRATKSPLEDI